jgi:hypothetical protein
MTESLSDPEPVPMNSLRPGIYKHYKGNLYQVMEVATHSETRESMVVYRPLYGERALWVRPLAMFTEEVEVNGVMVPRFAWQSAAPAPEAIKAAAQTRPVERVVATPTPVAPVSSMADMSVEERVKAAMARGDDKPDFSSMPVFDDKSMLIKAGVGAVLVIALLIWLL